MNINISNLNSAYRLDRQQMAVNTFMRQQTTVTGSIDMLLVINNDSSKVRKHGETYEVAGVQFTADQIPEMDTSKLSEVKACNNIIDFGQNHYFKYVSSDGTEHDAVAQRYAHFWRYMMNKDPVYVGLHCLRTGGNGRLQNAG